MKSLASKLIGFQKLVTTILGIMIPTIVVIQVLLRYVFKAPLMGIEELLFFPTIWLYMLGGANASQQRNHIECGILTLYIKRPKSIMIFKIVKNTVSLIVSVWLLYWSFWLFKYSFNAWKTSDLLYIPMFFLESAPFIGLLLMTFYATVEWVDHVRVFIRERG